MELTVRTNGDVTVVQLPVAALEAANVAAFKAAVAPILSRENKVVLDLSPLVFVDSSGLGAILSCLRKLNARGGDLKLAAVSSSVRTVFELVRLHHVVDICNDSEEAVRRFA